MLRIVITILFISLSHCCLAQNDLMINNSDSIKIVRLEGVSESVVFASISEIRNYISERLVEKESNIMYLDSFNIKKNVTIRMPNVTFAGGMPELVTSSYPSLNYLVSVMKKHPTMKIELQGNICCKNDGTDGLNPRLYTNTLSLERAKEAYNYLIRKGIDKNRLSYIGYGSSNKILNDEIGKLLEPRFNRRVDVKIVEE